MEGFQMTWAKCKGKHDAIEDKLDRGLATFDWMDLFPNFKLTNFVAQFENLWLLEPELNDIVHHGWIKSLSDDIIAKINSFSEEMNTWDCKLRRKYDDQIQSFRQELEATRNILTADSIKVK
ncbi:hypothetical protein JHK82_043690 [Glycine max]|nr:hypothetical protein JHK82_043690 [Glycine max]